ncbi:GNAT family N-acetyltransferase [Paraburkholderia phymatum]|uniref:GNAT family N-acetyltransferase n=1 Tax=Paraburkholderia phymatum TaxID=148447 RepID=A0ACC6U4H6_9BURK
MCLQNEEAGVPDPNSNGVIAYRPFTSDDIAAAHALSSAVRWRHRPDDWCFAARTGQGFVAEDGSGVIGTALSWRFGREAATLGMLIVAPGRQRRGVGRKLIELLIEDLGTRTLLIHASPAGLPLCEQFGFRSIGTIHQHQGAAFQPPLVSLPAGERLRPLGVNDAPRLVELASRASGLDRRELLPQLLDISSGIALDRDGELIGFALFRRFGDGHVIGPVIAPGSPDASRAKALISHWLALNAGMFVRVDTPVEHGLSTWLEGLGLPHVDSIERMMRNGPLPVDAQFKQFAIASQAVW